MTYVDEGWWHPNVKSGQVHGHNPNQPGTMHRLCERVYTKRGDTDPRQELADYVKETLWDGAWLDRLPKSHEYKLEELLEAVFPEMKDG